MASSFFGGLLRFLFVAIPLGILRIIGWIVVVAPGVVIGLYLWGIPIAKLSRTVHGVLDVSLVGLGLGFIVFVVFVVFYYTTLVFVMDKKHWLDWL